MSNAVELMTIGPRDSSSNYLTNNEFSSHEYNLFQQFFVVGLDPKICYNIYELDLKKLPQALLLPKVISKIPYNNPSYINIPDSFISSHCFPKGLLDKIIYCTAEELSEKSKQIEEWIFSLDNIAIQDYSSSLKTNKLYYSCLLFYEKIEKFKNLMNYRKEVNLRSKGKIDEGKNKNILIPKVICISSFSPIFMYGKKILPLIKKYCDNFNYESLFDKDNFYPIENILDSLIYNLPGLPRGKFSIKLDLKTFLSEDDLENANRGSKINNQIIEMIMEESQINKSPKARINYSLLMTFFTVEELFDIIRSIILEEPILFFSEDIFNLTYTIEGIIQLIYPFSYPHPVVSVLPEENYSLINVFYHFIFGINYKYSEDLWKLKFDYLGDKKKIIIVPIETRFPNFLNDMDKEKTINSVIITKESNMQKPMIQLSQLSKYKEIYKAVSEKNLELKIKTIKLPIHYSSKCIKRLEPLIINKLKEEKTKKNRELTTKEKDEICNKEIIDNFLYFFTCIFLNYQEYCIKYEKIKNPVQNLHASDPMLDKDVAYYKRPEKIEEQYANNELKTNDLFKIADFIANTQSIDRPFYERFFKTKVFFNFIQKKIFPLSLQDKLDILFFDEKINEKLSREMKLKKIETKFLEDKSDIIEGEISIESINREISDETKEFFENKHNCELGLNYFQYIIKDTHVVQKPVRPYGSEDENSHENDKSKNNFKFYYFVFPKLLNDGIFYKNKKKEQFENIRYIKYNSSCFYNKFEKEGIKYINNPMMINNYKNYNYSLTPVSPKIPNHLKYINAINKLWLSLFAKTFYSIPNNEKLNNFYHLIHFLNINQKSIDENSLIMLFNTFYKYGDKSINEEFFMNFSRKKKTYTSFLFLKEKVKKKNNYIDLRSCAEKPLPLGEKFLFIVHSYCTKIEEGTANTNLYNVCGEQTIMDISAMFNEKDKYISFECNKELNKIPEKQALIISCFYEKGNGLRYQINFRLISPAFILKQNWFNETDNLSIELMRKNHLECYLSTLFYFHQQGLMFNFLLPKTNSNINLQIENIFTNEKNEELKKEEEKKEEEKKEDFNLNAEIDLGSQNIEFMESSSLPIKKKRSIKKSQIKKKTTNTIAAGEFKINLEENE